MTPPLDKVRPSLLCFDVGFGPELQAPLDDYSGHQTSPEAGTAASKSSFENWSHRARRTRCAWAEPGANYAIAGWTTGSEANRIWAELGTTSW